MHNPRARPGRMSKKIKNPSKPKGINKSEVKSIINAELFQFDFNADYHQIMLRISNAPNGLKYGSPPPKVV